MSIIGPTITLPQPFSFPQSVILHLVVSISFYDVMMLILITLYIFLNVHYYLITAFPWNIR